MLNILIFHCQVHLRYLHFCLKGGADARIEENIMNAIADLHCKIYVFIYVHIEIRK